MRNLLILSAAALFGLAPAVSAQTYGTYGDPLTAVDSWYRTYLGRTALNDPGSAGWVNLLRQGNPPLAVLSGILGSDEYFNRVGGTMPAFIQAFYREALGRPLSQGEYNFWLRRGYTHTRQELAYEMLMQNPVGGIVIPPAPVVVVPDRERERLRHHEEHDYRRPYYPYQR